MAPAQGFHDRYRNFINRSADKIRLTKHTVVTQLIAETLGTLLLIFYGDGSVAQKFLECDAGNQFLAVSLGWGAAVCVCIVVTGKACPAILNPAIAVSNTIIGSLRWSLMPIYILLEFVGAYLGAGLVLAVYNAKIAEYTKIHDNGVYLVNSTGGIFVAGKGSSVSSAVVDQIVTTALLVIGIYGITEDRLVKKSAWATPAIVGMVVYLAVGTYTANASSALNPARDFGPRLLLLSTYWGVSAFTIDDYYFWVPLCMPIVGAVIGAILYKLLLGIHTEQPEKATDDKELEDFRVSVAQESVFTITSV